MNEPRDEELTAREREALSVLPRERAPRSEVEDALVKTLRDQGLLRRKRTIPMFVAAAAAVVLFAAGWFGGRTRVASQTQARWVFLLHDAKEIASLPPEEMNRRVQEYGAWARKAAARGLIDGHKLADGGLLMSSSESGVDVRPLPADADILGGFFFVGEADEAAARALAETCPHLHYGGVLELRRVEL